MKDELSLFIVSGLCSIAVLVLIYIMLAIGTGQM